MSKEPIFYGGQAVIGGVLINCPKGWSLAVRDNNGEIKRYFEMRTPLVKRNFIFGSKAYLRISLKAPLFACLRRTSFFSSFLLFEAISFKIVGIGTAIIKTRQGVP